MSLLEGKCVLITGAAGGIGQAAAVRFAGEGAKVVLSDVSATALSETADLARSKSRDVAVVEARRGIGYLAAIAVAEGRA